MTQLQVRVLNSIRQLEEEANEWRALWDRCVDARSPFLSFEWIRAWVEHYGQDEGLYVLMVRDEHRVVGIMPLVAAATSLRLAARFSWLLSRSLRLARAA